MSPSIATASDGLELSDECFVSSWDLEDRNYVSDRYFANTNKIVRMLKSERLGSARRHQLVALKNQLITELRERLRRRYNDQTVYDFDMKNRHFEPQKIGYKYDRVLNDGIQAMFDTLVGETGPRDWHMAAGDGSSDTFPNTKSLDHEIVRVPIVRSDTGFFTSAGTTLNAGGMISESIQTFPVREIGAVAIDEFDDAPTSPDIFLFRSVFPSTDIVTHNFGTNFTVAVHAIYAKSV